MDSPPKLTGETLIVHHIPLVHCQIPDRQCCSMGKRSNPFCHTDLGITRTTSLPEKDLLQKETLVYSSLIQASCLPFGASDEIEVRHPDLKGTGGEQHNSFILNEYIGPENSSHSSFHLQKNRNMNKPPFPLHEQPFHLHGIENITKQWSLASRQGIAEGQEEQNGIADGKTSNQIIMSRPPSDDQLELPMCNYNNGSSSSLFFDCDQGLDSSPDGSFRKQDLLESRTCSSSSLDIQQNRGIFSDQSEIIDNQHMTYNSDSSCNSSDGVLVNFTAIYNKMKSQSKSNLSLGNVSHDSSYCGHPEMGAFYLDLHSSPNEPKNSCEIHNEDSVMTTCSCHQRCSPALDANCNSYHLPCENMPCSSENSDFTACFQSHARLVVATQNYYKLVTCDLSSQSTPSPVESSITSCSEEHTKSTSPGQPTEYYLFQKPEDMKKDNRIEECVEETAMVETTEDLIEGQVYVNVAASNTAGRQRSRSYDRNLDKSPSPRLGSLERMYSCPGKLSDGQSGTSQRSPPRRVTSFAEIARTRKRSGNSPPLKSSGESSLEFSPILENQKENHVFLNLDEDHYHSLPGISSTRVDLTASCGAPFIHRFNKKGSKNVYETDHLENKMSCRTQHSEEATQKLEPINTFHNQMANGASFDGGVKAEGQSVKQLQSYYNDFFPDYFSLAEKPPAEFCLSPDGNTESVSIDLLQKKGLVKAVNTAVDLIVAHFGTSREPGVKAKLGNSSVSPNVGHLILKYLCPAMRNILQDGLKAYVLDVIVGQRKNLPWTVIEASTQLGPSTKALNNLFCKISQYTELTNHSIRFNAFIFGLLNIRSLEFWFNHLNNHEDIIGVHYLPTGFLALSHSVCQPLFEELLLLLQPLSLLPFDLDLMFEHQVMQMNKEQLKKKEQLRVKQDLLQSVHSTFQLMRTKGDGVSFSSGPETNRESRSEGIAQSEDAKVATARDGIFVDEPDEDVQTMERKSKEKVIAMKKDKQAGWWYQLMQSSQVYIEGSGDGSNFVKWEKRKKQSTAAAPQWQRGGIEKVPLREGVAEGAENGSVCGLEKSNITSVPCRHSREGAAAKEHRGEAQTKGPKKEAKPSWMGSPPESMLHELKPSKANGNMVTREQAAEGKPSQELAAGRPGMWWGRLFGASVNQTRKEEPCLGKSQRSRLPSGWLGLDQSVYDLMVQTMGTGKWRGPPPTVEQTPQQSGGSQPESQETKAQHERTVKALCHHIATEKGQLSFKKGDILRVVSKVDADWLLCGLGAECGLVPIMYVTHPEDEDY
ncbi:iporin isoform X5 [Callorhinchus milii]|uniref:iporin isoform X5 n=1 Tax=Callorhinchus milii TaxID=7868 RepID=UPI001C3FB9FB|nr:iporin isoform X5 [Callorhinchus milii]